MCKVYEKHKGICWFRLGTHCQDNSLYMINYSKTQTKNPKSEPLQHPGVSGQAHSTCTTKILNVFRFSPICIFPFLALILSSVFPQEDLETTNRIILIYLKSGSEVHYHFHFRVYHVKSLKLLPQLMEVKIPVSHASNINNYMKEYGTITANKKPAILMLWAGNWHSNLVASWDAHSPSWSRCQLCFLVMSSVGGSSWFRQEVPCHPGGRPTLIFGLAQCYQL